MSILTQIQRGFPKAETYSLQNEVKLLKINELQGRSEERRVGKECVSS